MKPRRRGQLMVRWRVEAVVATTRTVVLRHKIFPVSPNDIVYLPGRFKERDFSEKRNADPVKCNALSAECTFSY